MRQALAVGIVGALGLACGLLVLRLRSVAATERRHVGFVIVGAFILRLSVMLLLHTEKAWFLGPSGAVAPDELALHRGASLVAQSGLAELVSGSGGLHVSWVLIVSAFYRLFGPSLIIVKALNVALGTLLVLLIYIVGRNLFDHRVGLLSAIVMAAYPTAVAWSVFALRESFIAILLVVALIGARFAIAPDQTPRTQLGSGLASVAALVVMFYTRSYMVFAVLLLVLAVACVIAVSQRSWQPTAGAALLVAVFAVTISLMPMGPRIASLNYNLVANPQPDMAMNPLSDERPERPAGDVSGRDSRELASMVEGTLVGILGGRPQWRPQEFYLLVQPGILLWWLMLPAFAYGVIVLLQRQRLFDGVLLGGWVIGVALFQIVTGSSIRHHFMMEPLAVLVAVVGIERAAHATQTCRRVLFGAIGVMALGAVGSIVSSFL